MKERKEKMEAKEIKSLKSGQHFLGEETFFSIPKWKSAQQKQYLEQEAYLMNSLLIEK